MSHNPWRNRSVATLAALLTVALIAAAGAQSAWAQEDESVHVSGEVDVFGQYEWLDVWNHERFVAKLQREPYADEDARALSEFGI